MHERVEIMGSFLAMQWKQKEKFCTTAVIVIEIADEFRLSLGLTECGTGSHPPTQNKGEGGSICTPGIRVNQAGMCVLSGGCVGA